MICKRCFRMSDDGFEYCPYCGKSFTDDSEIEVKKEEGDEEPRVEPPHRDAPDNDPMHRPDDVPQGQNYGYTMPPPSYPFYGYQPREKSPAGKFFSALGHAALYFLLFFLCQTIVSTIIMFGVIANSEEFAEAINEYAMNPNMSREQYDELMERAYDAIMNDMGGTTMNMITIFSAVLTIFFVFLVSVGKHRPFSAHVGLYPFHSWLALLLVPLGISAQFLVSELINLIPWPDSVVNEFNGLYSYMGRGDSVFDVVVEILAVVIFAPMVEELVFRGCVYTRLRRGMPVGAAVILAAFAFGIAHGAAIAVFYASLLAVLLIFMYEKFGTILAPFLVHLGFNLANYIPLLREDSSQTEVIVTLVVSAVVFVICLAVIIISNVGKREHSIDEDRHTDFPPMPPMPPVV